MRHREITIEDFEGFEASSLVASSGDRKIHAIVIPNEGMAYYRVTWSKGEFRDFPISKFRQAIDYYNNGGSNE